MFLSIGHYRIGTSLVLYPGGLEVLDEIKEVLIWQCTTFSGDDCLWIRRALIFDTRALCNVMIVRCDKVDLSDYQNYRI